MEETRTESIVLPKTKVFSMALLTASFLIPLFLSGPQIMVGIVVNMVLYLSVRFFGMKRSIPLIFLPSIGAALNGIIFGIATQYLILFIPFIWAGNYLMMHVYDYYRKVLPRMTVILASAAVKAALLFAVALLFVRSALVPQLFITAMGAVQFVTALVGGILALTVERIILKSHDRR